MSIAWGAIGLIALVSTTACGPVLYVNQVTRKASTQVAAARSAEADKYSPYWYTLAVEYLHKAREEVAHADFQAANRFGRKSEAAARKARKEAIERAANPANTDWMPPAELGSGSGSAIGSDPGDKSEDRNEDQDKAMPGGFAPIDSGTTGGDGR